MGKAYQSCTPSTERSEHLNAGSSPALEGLQGQGTESLVEFEAKPQSATADQAGQNKVKKHTEVRYLIKVISEN